MTLGGSAPCRLGVPVPPPGDNPPVGKRSEAAARFWPELTELEEVTEFEDCIGDVLPWLALDVLPSCDGRGLFRGSFSEVVEADGVATGDCAASREDPPRDDGEDVPSFESLFLDFEDLFGSLVRESCSCWMCQ